MRSHIGRIQRATFMTAGLMLATPTIAQDEENDQPRTSVRLDKFRIIVAGALAPDYVGSDDYSVIPAPSIRGTLDGFNFETLGTSFDVDLFRDNGRAIDLQLGPVIGLNLDRTSRLNRVKDAQVAALGKLKRAVEVGGYVGIAKTGVVTSAYDSLSFSVSWQKDVAGAHDSYILSPTLDYATPLSKRSYAGIALSADFVGDKYASYYYSISEAGALASGLPSFTAKGGLKDVSLTLTGLQSLSGDLRHGWSLVALVSFTRLMGDASRSPIVSIAGSNRQWLAGLGVSYAFK